MKTWYRPAFILSAGIHAAIFAAVDSFDLNSLRSPSIEVEIVLGDASGAQASQQMPARQKRSSPKADVRPDVDAEQIIDPAREVVQNVDERTDSESRNEDEVSDANSAPNSNLASNVSSGMSSGAGPLTPEQRYLAEVRRILESKKNYPMAARRLGHQGRVIVRFVVGRDGQILEAKITQGSTSDILNRAARSLIENIGGLKPFPTEIRMAEWAVVVPIEYQM